MLYERRGTDLRTLDPWVTWFTVNENGTPFINEKYVLGSTHEFSLYKFLTSSFCGCFLLRLTDKRLYNDQ